jgi:4-hydroxythreonine-4-phosphate dehydrogenase
MALDHIDNNYYKSPNYYLLTLPANKKDFKLHDKQFRGHTEYLGHKYNSKLSMNFVSPDYRFLLITDHIPLSAVTSAVNEEEYISKISSSIKFYTEQPHLASIETIILYGINPHSGENGSIGYDESIFKNIKQKIEHQFDIRVETHRSADTFIFNHLNDNQLHVFAYHDQGLSLFKTISRFHGINLTTGLPFIRISPDHGTAPDLVYKNKAHYLSTWYCLKFLESLLYG